MEKPIGRSEERGRVGDAIKVGDKYIGFMTNNALQGGVFLDLFLCHGCFQESGSARYLNLYG